MAHEDPTKDPEGCKRPVGFFHYKVCYPEKDACGGDLTKIEGAHIELLKPGHCDFERIAFIPYPEQTARVEVYKDGQYAVRHVVVGACTESEPSKATPVSIDLTPPEQPPKGEVMVPCPQ